MSESFGLFKGLKVTFKELFRKSVTDKYYTYSLGDVDYEVVDDEK